MFIFRPFWYLVGENTKWLPIGTFWIPLIIVSFLFSVPYIFKKKAEPGSRMGLGKKVGLALVLLSVWVGTFTGVTISGRHAKTNGCTSCHNPMMGIRQALPPANMAEFYSVERARQIQVGHFRIGDSTRVGSSYKDSNWQLRHFYEPTMTW